MTSEAMPEKRAIAMHLSYSPPQDGVHLFSGFAHALREARQMTSRDPDSGQKREGVKGSWLGAVGYLILLDQIGKCFKPKNVLRAAGTSIEQALQHFTQLTTLEIKALYALRCAFAHDYSLQNISRKDPTLTHRFAVRVGGTAKVVSLPSKPWNGDLKTVGTETQTTVSLEALGDLVEEIVVRLCDLASRDELEILLEGGSDELLRRYYVFARV